jgi:hypothetical protein
VIRRIAVEHVQFDGGEHGVRFGVRILEILGTEVLDDDVRLRHGLP